ncbi:hypothetical protein RJ55_04483 [Drechmeria coniospora]|nr:hypothetical protein RJ55_04483 [Drechmeria coniospora]
MSEKKTSHLLVPSDLPEVAPHQHLPEVYRPTPPPPPPLLLQEASREPAVGYDHRGLAPGYSEQPVAGPVAAGWSPSERQRPRTLCGCGSLVFLLSVVIAVLAAAVVGLAAGAGILVGQRNDANARFERLKLSVTPQEGLPSWANVTRGCTDDPKGTTGETFQPPFFNNETLVKYCNKDAVGTPFYSLFASDFNGCMSACASWNFHNASTKTTCGAVSFIPLWSVQENALAGGAPGDCYLKTPQGVKDLKEPNIGTECHAALVKR